MSRKVYPINSKSLGIASTGLALGQPHRASRGTQRIAGMTVVIDLKEGK
jgi:hypothetical protein